MTQCARGRNQPGNPAPQNPEPLVGSIVRNERRKHRSPSVGATRTGLRKGIPPTRIGEAYHPVIPSSTNLPCQHCPFLGGLP
jgi:hypothetical protein